MGFYVFKEVVEGSVENGMVDVFAARRARRFLALAFAF